MLKNLYQLHVKYLKFNFKFNIFIVIFPFFMLIMILIIVELVNNF